MGIRDMISLILFLAFLALFAGLMTGVVSGDAVFSVVRDGISKVGDALAKLLG
jgi:H+/gluconate symporter-like permease